MHQLNSLNCLDFVGKLHTTGRCHGLGLRRQVANHAHIDAVHIELGRCLERRGILQRRLLRGVHISDQHREFGRAQKRHQSLDPEIELVVSERLQYILGKRTPSVKLYNYLFVSTA